MFCGFVHMWLLKSSHACWNFSNDTSLRTVAIILWERLRSFIYLTFHAFKLTVVSAPYLCTNPFLKRIWLFIHPLSISGWDVFMVFNVKTAVYRDVTSCILVGVYVHFVGTCRIFIPILKMNILKDYIASIVSSVQTMKLVDGRKHSQGNTVCTFSSTYRMETRICYVMFWRNVLSPSSFHPDETHTTVQKSCVAIWPYYFGPEKLVLANLCCSLVVPSSFAHHHVFKPMFFFGIISS